ncbi:MAG: MotA/TolQ/ExbB proton channel family protein [Akkermansiaceae bacterium]|jgi:flagellar motor component MotA|nr:MotA/TolQ/ExbB proton channel family protein [Akkermansiaceae bacterium]
MNLEFQCPHCQLNMTCDSEHAGKIVACPGCNGRFTVPVPQNPVLAGTSSWPGVPARQAAAQRGGWQEEDHANINFGASLGIGALVTAALLLVLVPFRGAYFSDLFLQRGWVNYAEVFLFLWGCVILVMKSQKAKRQEQAMLLDVLPARLGAEINIDTVALFIEHIYKLPARLRDSLMVNRIRKGLELFEKRNDNGEVAAILNAQSDIDANRISGSYTLLKVFLWAIPILGFIGTVQGLSVAVGSLSAGSTDPEALKNSINTLTGGLGVAFDTTLLGLVLSLLMSFPMAAMQKREEEVLTLIDAFCNEKLLPKLNDSAHAADAGNKLLAGAESLPAFAAALADAHAKFLERLDEATALLKGAAETLGSRMGAHQQVVESTFAEAVQRLAQATTDSFGKPTQQLNEYFAALNKGVESLNGTLKQLGGETITIRKRGLFS